MRARSLLVLTVLAAAATALLLSGCGTVAPTSAQQSQGRTLTIYSSMPLQGASAAAAEQTVDGEQLALADAHHVVGRYYIQFVSLDDAGASGLPEPGLAEANAKTAVKNETTIAYLGDYDSASTAVSLPVTNKAGILQVSTRSPYVGLTSSFDAGQGDPERFYPSGKRTFIRLLPGDIVQGAAQLALLKALNVHRLFVLSDGEPFTAPLATIVADRAKKQGIEVVGQETVEVANAGSDPTFPEQVHKVLEAGAEAVFLSGQDDPGTVALWRELHANDPALYLLGTSEMAESALPSELGAAEGVSYLTSPVLPPSSYPKAARKVLRQFRHRFHMQGNSYALYGYEAMDLVLSAIRSAGEEGNNREAVVKAAFSLQRRNSVLGPYSVLPDGETTLIRYGVDRVHNDKAVFWRELPISGPNVP